MNGEGRKARTAEGAVLEALPGLTFKIRLNSGAVVLGHLSGKMRLNHIRIFPGDRVLIEMGEADEGRGRIVRRL